MIDLGLSASTKLAVIQIIKSGVLQSKKAIPGFDLSYFYFLVVHFKHLHLFFTLYLFQFFIREQVNHTNIHASLTFLVSIMSSTTLVAQLVSILSVKKWKVVMKCKKSCILTSELFSSKCTFLRLRHVVSPSSYPINSIFSMVVRICKIHALDKAFHFCL